MNAACGDSVTSKSVASSSLNETVTPRNVNEVCGETVTSKLAQSSVRL